MSLSSSTVSRSYGLFDASVSVRATDARKRRLPTCVGVRLQMELREMHKCGSRCGRRTLSARFLDCVTVTPFIITTYIRDSGVVVLSNERLGLDGKGHVLSRHVASLPFLL